MNPTKRKADLVVERLPDETLVYDLRNHRAYCLNLSSSLVWNHCDGKTGISDLATLVAQELKVPDSKDLVQLALDELKRARLITGGPEEASNAPALSRRDAVRRLGLAGILGPLIPAVVSLVAPTAASAVTCVGDKDCKNNPRAFVGLCCCSARRKCTSQGKCGGAVC